MKCTECSNEADFNEFRYLYNARIDSSTSLRQCPNCHSRLMVDEGKQVVLRKQEEGEDPWGKDTGIEKVAPAA